MNPEKAFAVINGLFLEKANTSLSECQKDIILGIWQGKTYQVISDETSWSYQTVKGAASDLFKKIGEFLEVEVNKANFVNTINHFYQQKSVEAPPTQVLVPQPNNPFVPQNGGVDNPQQFFDRSQTISRIFEILNSGSSVALIGEEGIGKSSLLYAVCQLAESRLTMPRQPIFLDLNEIDDEEDFYCALCSEAEIPKSTGYQLKRNLAQRSQKLLLAGSGE